jgi:RNA polymerase sigma-70 factor (ECF subfamily)
MTEDEIRKEEQVIERSKKDPQAFGELYEKYFDRIFNYIYRQTDDEELAGDCVLKLLSMPFTIFRYEFRGFPFRPGFIKLPAMR